MKPAIFLILLAIDSFLCSASGVEAVRSSQPSVADYASLISKTTPYPASYAEAAAHRGRIERIDHMTFHEKDVTRREFRPTVEYVYNALPFFFPSNGAAGVSDISISKPEASTRAYNILGQPSSGHGIVIESGRKYIKR